MLNYKCVQISSGKSVVFFSCIGVIGSFMICYWLSIIIIIIIITVIIILHLLKVDYVEETINIQFYFLSDVHTEINQ